MRPMLRGAIILSPIQKGRPHMNLRTQLTDVRSQTGHLAANQRAAFACCQAKELERIGEYDAASEAFIDFWPERDRPPKLDELDELIQAEVLLRIGALAGWLGGANQT